MDDISMGKPERVTIVDKILLFRYKPIGVKSVSRKARLIFIEGPGKAVLKFSHHGSFQYNVLSRDEAQVLCSEMNKHFAFDNL